MGGDSAQACQGPRGDATGLSTHHDRADFQELRGVVLAAAAPSGQGARVASERQRVSSA